MRRDMAKVIVERPRWGSSLPSLKKGYLKTLQRTPVDELPRREPLLGRWHGRQRYLNEHLGPMRRFLRSNVGRPWNKVHQELCEYVSFENAVQSHVLDHIYDFVEREVVLINNRPHYAQSWRRGCPLRLNQMYVCPATGLLKIVSRQRREALPTRLHPSDQLMHILKDQIWWEVRVRKIPADAEDLWDVWLERRVDKLSMAEVTAAYGDVLFAMSKRPLTPSETRQLLRRRRQAAKSRSKKRFFRWRDCSSA